MLNRSERALAMACLARSAWVRGLDRASNHRARADRRPRVALLGPTRGFEGKEREAAPADRLGECLHGVAQIALRDELELGHLGALDNGDLERLNPWLSLA